MLVSICFNFNLWGTQILGHKAFEIDRMFQEDSFRNNQSVLISNCDRLLWRTMAAKDKPTPIVWTILGQEICGAGRGCWPNHKYSNSSIWSFPKQQHREIQSEHLEFLELHKTKSEDGLLPFRHLMLARNRKMRREKWFQHLVPRVWTLWPPDFEVLAVSQMEQGLLQEAASSAERALGAFRAQGTGIDIGSCPYWTPFANGS